MPHPFSAPHGPSIDVADVAKFEQLGEDWWNLSGSMKALHRFNPVRIAYIRDHICAHFGRNAREPLPLLGLRLLDIGCGGGILSEPLARLGADVTGIDPAPGNIAIATRHAAKTALPVTYLATTAEDLNASGAKFDVVLAMEVVEHVRQPAAFIKTACNLVDENGLFFAATLNRTLKSFALAIVGAEYVLGWMPKGTHQWEKFLTPEELRGFIEKGGLNLFDEAGVSYNPLRDEWRQSHDRSVNYMLVGKR
eukprot:gene16866-17052_t